MPTPHPLTTKAKKLLECERGIFYCTFCGFENGVPDETYDNIEGEGYKCDFGCGDKAKYWQSSYMDSGSGLFSK